MNNIDKELEDMKENLKNIEVPDELESTLRQGLNSASNKRKRFNYKAIIAASAIVIFFIGYNADAISYYGKRLIGYESVMNFTLNQLNELGSGQAINKSYTFKDGIKVTLDGVMLDDNNIVTFYTIYNENHSLNDNHRNIHVSLESLLSNYSGGGEGRLSDDGQKMTWVSSYTAPHFFEKNMKLSLYNNETEEYGEIKFKLDRSKAVGKSLKLPLNKTVKFNDQKIHFNDLIASPITTVVDGKFQDIFELGKDALNGDRIYFNDIELELLADGDKISLQSGGMSTNLKGSYFHKSFDTLPKYTKEVELVLKSLAISENVDEKVDLNNQTFPKTIDVLDRDITINKIYEKDGNTYVNITTEEDVYLTSLFLNIDGKDIRNERTIDETFDKIVEKDGVKKLLRSRTVEFIGSGKKLELKIKKISYNKEFDETIYSNKIK